LLIEVFLEHTEHLADILRAPEVGHFVGNEKKTGAGAAYRSWDVKVGARRICLAIDAFAEPELSGSSAPAR
jgi:hypothetical protein